jgi:hypothetical protein
MKRAWMLGSMLALVVLLSQEALTQTTIETKPSGWQTIAWDYPLTPPWKHVGFLIEACLQHGTVCTMEPVWTVGPLVLSQAIPKPPKGQVRCVQIRAIGEAGRSEPTKPVCFPTP